MADNYLEKHYEDYLKKKALWEKKNRHILPSKQVNRPEKEGNQS